MGTGTKIAVIAGGAIAAAAALYYLTQTVQGGGSGSFILQISATEGGTTNPAPSPSGITYPAGKVVKITVTPNGNYSIGEVLIDGVSVGSLSSFQVTMNMSHTVNVIFYEGGQEPVGAPVAILPPNSTTITGYYIWTVDLGFANVITLTRCRYTDKNWTIGNYQNYPITFKVIDANGQGVPNIPLQVYPDLFPDNSAYRGYIAINDQAVSRNQPLTIYTDANGNATIRLSYWYGISILNDNYLKLSQDAEIYVNGLIANIYPATFNPYDGWDGKSSSLPVLFTGKGGDKTVPPSPTFNTIIARIPGTSISQVQAVVYCQIHTKML
jgi:hypothetical protein